MIRILRAALAAAGLAVLCVPAVATTGWVTVSASNLTDFSGGPVSNATISFVPVNNQGQIMSAKIGTSSGGQGTVTSVTVAVVSGAFSTTLADTALTNPVNVCYQVTVTDNSTGNVLLSYPCVQPASSGAAWCSGTSCDFDNYIPSTPAGALASIGPQGPQGTSGTNCASGGSPGTCTFNGTLVATVALHAPNISKGAVLYASGSCAVNSNINSGGGTDDAVCLQTLLSALATAGGGTLVQDGVSLLSAAATSSGGQTTALQIGSNVKIECTNNGGFYLANAADVTMIGNQMTGTANTFPQSNVAVTGCGLNGNGANQSRYELGNSNNEWNFCVWFGGVDGVTLKGNAFLNCRTYSIIVSNAIDLVIEDNATIQTAGYGAGGNNHDGIHLWGPITNMRIHNYRDDTGDDDVLAFNTDEGVVNYNGLVAAGGWQPARCPTSGGAIQDVFVDGVYVENSNDAVRWIGYTVSGGVSTVANITLKNIYGNPVTFGSTVSNITANGGISVDGWWLGGANNNLTLPPGANPLNVKNIYSAVTYTPPSSSTLANDNAQLATFVAGSGAGTSPTIGCYSGFTCTAELGVMGLIVGSSPPSNAPLAVISWPSAFTHFAACEFTVFDNTSSTILANVIANVTAATTTSGEAYVTSALTAAHNLAITYHCK